MNASLNVHCRFFTAKKAAQKGAGNLRFPDLHFIHPGFLNAFAIPGLSTVNIDKASVGDRSFSSVKRCVARLHPWSL